MTLPCGITYRLGRTLYVALTNSCNAVSLIQSRGPGFAMPVQSGFAPLPEGFTPSAEEVYQAVEAAQGDYDSIAFAGAGEPLLRLGVLEQAAQLLLPKGATASEHQRARGAERGTGACATAARRGPEQRERGPRLGRRGPVCRAHEA